MRTNIQKAVVIIASLSLMLGLSLGQNHLQQKKINQLQKQMDNSPLFQFKSQIFSTPFEIKIDKFDREEKKCRKRIKKKRCERPHPRHKADGWSNLEIELEKLEEALEELEKDLDAI